MFDPSIPASGKSENRYMIASIIGKRAVQLAKGSNKLTDCESDNNVTIAISEYKQDKLTYTSSERNETESEKSKQILYGA
jgi:DNA-directed RNA polymerase subunit K/omega